MNRWYNTCVCFCVCEYMCVCMHAYVCVYVFVCRTISKLKGNEEAYEELKDKGLEGLKGGKGSGQVM